jgi:hypothetical protein
VLGWAVSRFTNKNKRGNGKEREERREEEMIKL